MGDSNPLNIYTGEDSLKKYYDPDQQPPLPLVEIPASLNPYRKDGVRIYAKMMTMLPANNVKALPARGLLEKTVDPGRTKTIIEYSSGSTVISMSLLGRVYHGIDDTRAYLSNKTSDTKLKLMQFFGLNIKLHGGPSQPEPLDERGGIQAARRKAQTDETVANPNQYENDANWQAHYRWTGPQILKQLPHINILCAGMGTSGTMTGLGTYFNDAKPSVLKVGVCTAAGDRVPGPRSLALMSPVEFPWRKAIDALEEVGSVDSYALSLALTRQGLICGPSSGFNLKGLYQFLEKRKQEGTLKDLANEDGEIHCVFLCCDLPYQYVGEYFEKLDSSHFHPIVDARLGAVDKYRYDEAWELTIEDALNRFFDVRMTVGHAAAEDLPWNLEPRATTAVLDMRRPQDYHKWHLPGAVNVPMRSVKAETPSVFFDSAALEEQWLEMEAFFTPQCQACTIPGVLRLQDRQILLVCYNGDTARVATSILRAKGIQADSVAGGAGAMLNWRPKAEGKWESCSSSEKDKTKANIVETVTMISSDDAA
ncbi:putative cysteine synthase B [Phyllosticta capitalensis]|uniref:Cysteine synthase B n=1 Tax=Phyllosticta capitalensis TaxID=121624 RepID=A0ABR1YZP6_9PEZI